MRGDRLVARWIGVALTLLAVIGTLWLAATGRLELYVHPRYTVFTVVLALIGGALAVAGLVTGLRGGDGHRHGHGHGAAPDGDADDANPDDGGYDGVELAPEDPLPRRRVGRRLLTSARVLIVAVAGVALLVLPPATLSAATAQNRSIASESQSLPTVTAPTLVGGSTAGFTVKDWFSLLRTGDPDAVTGQKVDVTGYLLPAGDSRDVVYVARLLVTCCAVDAQPVGVPVYLPDWRREHPANSWIELEGAFQENPDAGSSVPLVVVPSSVTRIPEPAKPYVY